MSNPEGHYDWIVVGSGFGGSVSALRLTEKGYRVLVIEKGRRYTADDLPKRTWDLKRWLWAPSVGLRGLTSITFLRHVSILSGVGVGGGSLIYACTHPVPKPAFYQQGSWAGLADWQAELAPHYATAKRMLGVTENPEQGHGEKVLQEIAGDLGREEHFEPTDVAIWFGEPGVTVPDPYFDGEGPDRTGCTRCGGCMLGCRDGAKNSLDKNYLWLAEGRGATVLPDTEVTAVRPRAEGGYRLEATSTPGGPRVFTADRVVLAGGVLGTVDLLLRMKQDPEGLPDLSPRVGDLIRTNSESILYVVGEDDADHDTGIAIGAILHTDDHSHVEPVRYERGTPGFYRTMLLPHAPGNTWIRRLLRMGGVVARRPLKVLRTLFRDLGRRGTVLLYMQSLEGTLRFRPASRLQRLLGSPVGSQLPEDGEAPAAYIPEATDIAERFAEKTGGIVWASFAETLFNAPTTAHILGGACIGATPEAGVIDRHHEVHGYSGLYVVDGAAVSANPGVNPSLTITAMAERAMAGIT